MLSNSQVLAIRSRFRIFQRRIYRLSFHIYNTQSDVEGMLEVLERNLDLLAIGAKQVVAS